MGLSEICSLKSGIRNVWQRHPESKTNYGKKTVSDKNFDNSYWKKHVSCRFKLQAWKHGMVVTKE